MVGPGALKPKVGDGIKSRRPLSAPVLHSFILLFFFLFCVCCCTSIGVYIIIIIITLRNARPHMGRGHEPDR